MLVFRVARRVVTGRLRDTSDPLRGRLPGRQFTPISGDGSAVDITHCPIADYLLSHGAGGLCVAAWCGQDGPVAERWGAQLRRTGTLATGARACDFRYGTGPTGRQPTAQS